MTNLAQLFGILILLSALPPDARVEYGLLAAFGGYTAVVAACAGVQFMLVKVARGTYRQRRHEVVAVLRILVTLTGIAAVLELDVIDGVFALLPVPYELAVVLGLVLAVPLLLVEWAATARSRLGQAPELGPYLKTNVALFVFTVSPVVLLAGFQALVSWLVPGFDRWMLSYEFLGVGVLLVGIVVMTWFLPFGVRLLLATQKVRGTDLETRMQALATALGVRVDRLYLWKSKRAGLHTAFLIGFAWPFRTIFVSDGLLEMMEDDEIDAVLAHELGHARHRHLLLFLGLFVTLILAQTALLKLVTPQVPVSMILDSTSENLLGNWLPLGVMVAAVALFLWLFGYVSRRFERQADFASAAVTSPEAMASALNRLGHMAGGIHQKKGWRHFSIARRIHELRVLTLPPELQEVALRKWSREFALPMILTLVVTLASIAVLVPWVRDDVLTGEGTLHLLKAEDTLLQTQSLDAAQGHYEAAIRAYDRYVVNPVAFENHRWQVRARAAGLEVLAFGTNMRVRSMLAALETKDAPPQREVWRELCLREQEEFHNLREAILRAGRSPRAQATPASDTVRQ